jgi:signal transduction histidine kinase
LEFDPDSAEMIQYIVDATKRMGGLIRSLLDFARTGRRNTPLDKVAMNEALEMALSNVRSAVAERNAEIRWGTLPEVRAHVDQLARVFQNLIANALKYCPEDRTPLIEITTERRGKEWLISVRDNGSGFEAAQSEAIFQSFYRLQANTESGSGLGLAICRKIVRSFGGRIWAESEPGEGAIFRWTIPAS